jgi:phospholipid/cholesterol/gamma-HCH transport system substrate-binding protein
MKSGRLALIGLLFVFSIVILFWGVNFLKGKKLLQPEKIFYAEYSTIGGLTESSPVTLNGFQIGRVREIALNDFHTGNISVRFVINYPDFELPVGSRASIVSTDLMGTKAIEILLSDSLAYYSYGDTIQGIVEADLRDQVNAQMLPLKQSAENLMASMDSVLVSLQLVFGPSNRENLAQSINSVTQTIKNLEKTSVFLNSYVREESEKFSFILSNTDSLASGLKNRREELYKTITNLSQFSDTLSQLKLNKLTDELTELLGNLNELSAGIIEGKGDLGRLTSDDSLYTALEAAAFNLNRLINDIRQNPKRYIRLSAFDVGKTVIASSDKELLDAIGDDSELVYYVCLFQSDKPLRDDERLTEFSDIQVIEAQGRYFYSVKETRRLEQGQRLVSKYLRDYPGAGLYTWINNKWHKVDF